MANKRTFRSPFCPRHQRTEVKYVETEWLYRSLMSLLREFAAVIYVISLTFINFATSRYYGSLQCISCTIRCSVAVFRSLCYVNLLYIGRTYRFSCYGIAICRDTAYVFLAEFEQFFACGDICGELLKLTVKQVPQSQTTSVSYHEPYVF